MRRALAWLAWSSLAFTVMLYALEFTAPRFRDERAAVNVTTDGDTPILCSVGGGVAHGDLSWSSAATCSFVFYGSTSE